MKARTLTRTVLIADQPTRNGTVYPEAVLRKAVEEAQSAVKARRFFGNATGDYPISLAAVTHVVTGLRMENNAMVADIEFLETPCGVAVVKAIEAVAEQMPGAALTLLPAGVGSTSPEGVVRDDYKLGSISVEWTPKEKK